MGATEFATTDAQAVKRWSNSLAREAISKTFFRRFLGKGPNSIIQQHTDLESAAGDQIKYDVIMQNRGDGVQGDTTLENYEEELEFYQATINIDQLRNAVSFRRMSQQRTLHNLRKEARSVLSDWFAWKYDTLMFAYLAGVAGDDLETASGTIGASGFAGNALTDYSSDTAHHIDESAGGGNSSFGLEILDVAKAKAKTLNPRLRPVMVNGSPKFVAVLHPYSVHTLRRETGANGWTEIHSRVADGGSKSPIYTGALGEYNGIVLHESEYIPRTTSTGDTANLFLGAQAASFAMGNAYDKTDQSSNGGGSYFSWNEQKNDYGNKKGIAAGSCFGIQRNIFNGDSFGTLLLETVQTTPAVS